jgi:tRNA G37 N-methylase Trm5
LRVLPELCEAINKGRIIHVHEAAPRDERTIEGRLAALEYHRERIDRDLKLVYDFLHGFDR